MHVALRGSISSFRLAYRVTSTALLEECPGPTLSGSGGVVESQVWSNFATVLFETCFKKNSHVVQGLETVHWPVFQGSMPGFSQEEEERVMRHRPVASSVPNRQTSQ